MEHILSKYLWDRIFARCDIREIWNLYEVIPITLTLTRQVRSLNNESDAEEVQTAICTIGLSQLKISRAVDEEAFGKVMD